MFNKSITTSQKVPGHSGAIARLAVLTVMILISVVACVGTLPKYIQTRGFGQALLDALCSMGTLLLTGAFIWAVMKWIAYAMPKAYRLAIRFWNGWIPLTFFGVYLKACAFCVILCWPACIPGVLFAPIMKLGMGIATSGITVFNALGMLLLGGGSAAVLAFWDICKLQGVQVRQVLSYVRKKKAA